MDIKSERLAELASLFEESAKSPTNKIDPPFDCVCMNLRPATLAEVGTALRYLATTSSHKEDAERNLRRLNETAGG